MGKEIDRLSYLPLPEMDKKELDAFCRHDADRFEVLTRSINRREILYKVIPLGQSKHILLPTPKMQEQKYYRITLTAHYDRVENSPGANDNSAAVFQLLSFWEEMKQEKLLHHTQILFTDKEELTGDMKATDQGSWMLARHLNRLGINNILFLVLDMCGIGDTLVWGHSLHKAGLQIGNNSISKAHNTLEKLLKKFSRDVDYGINPEFSDDLGLLLGGYPAIQISLLPRLEARELLKSASRETGETRRDEPAKHRERMSKTTPETWQKKHTPFDTPESLEPRAFFLMRRLLRAIAHYRIPLT